MDGIAPIEVKSKIDQFILNHKQSAVYVLAHVVLEDGNCHKEIISWLLSEWIPQNTEQWINDHLGTVDSSTFYTKAWLWSEVYQLIGFLNWLLWDVPESILIEVHNLWVN